MNIVNCPNRMGEDALIELSSKGDLEAFNQLVISHQDMVFHHALALLGDRDLAEDAAQESFIKAFQGLHDFRGGSFRSWLLKITTNSSYDLLRRSSRRPEIPLMPEDDEGEEIESPSWLADPGLPVQDTVERNEFSRKLYQMVDELPEAYRAVLTLIDLYELEYTEAAEILKVPLGTIRSRLARARLQLRRRLTKNPEISAEFRMVEANLADRPV